MDEGNFTGRPQARRGPQVPVPRVTMIFFLLRSKISRMKIENKFSISFGGEEELAFNVPIYNKIRIVRKVIFAVFLGISKFGP